MASLCYLLPKTDQAVLPASVPSCGRAQLVCLSELRRITLRPVSRAGKIHVRNTVEQLKLVGPRSLGVALLTAGFVGMVFTIQVRVHARPGWITSCSAGHYACERVSWGHGPGLAHVRLLVQLAQDIFRR